jgi:hypothetical protein
MKWRSMFYYIISQVWWTSCRGNIKLPIINFNMEVGMKEVFNGK